MLVVACGSPGFGSAWWCVRAEAAFPDDGILPTTLLTRKDEVDKLNASQLARLPASAQSAEFVATDSGNADAAENGCPARRVLQLKVGAQVILLRNISVESGAAVISLPRLSLA